MSLRRVLAVLLSIPFVTSTALGMMSFTRVTTAARASKGSDVLKTPRGVAVRTSDGTLFIADTANHRIRTLTVDGSLAPLTGGKAGWRDGTLADAQFRQPTAIVRDAVRDLVYVLDTGNHVVRRIDADGIVTTLAGSGRAGLRDGTGTSASFREPKGMAIDSDGVLWIADTGNHAIRRVSPGGVVASITGGAHPGFADGAVARALFQAPEGIAVFNQAVYVGDTGNHLVRRIENGVVATLAGTGHPGFSDGPARNAELKFPRGLAIDDDGILYVADSGNHAIRRIDRGVDPLLTTVAGTGRPGDTDGAVLTARFKDPSGLAFAGALFVADTGNDALRVILPALAVSGITPESGPSEGGTVVTIAGDGFIPGATTVRIGANASPTVTYLSSKSLTAVTPPGEAGNASVRVATPNGSIDLPDAFQYETPFVSLGTTPTSVTLASGESLPLRANGVTVAGVSTDVTRQVTWTSSRPDVATIDAGGVLRAVSDGVSTITASLGTLTATTFVTVDSPPEPPPFVSLHITPTAPTLAPGNSVSLLAEAVTAAGIATDVTSQVTWTSSRTDVATVDVTGALHGVFPGISVITASLGTLAASANATVENPEPLPPDPASIAPPLATAAITPFADAVRFLYDGPNAIQTGVAPDAVSAQRAAVVRGRVETRSGLPLGGVRVSIFGHPEWGQTLTRANGMYDLVVNGGGVLTLAFNRQTYFTVHRHVTVDWRDIANVDSVKMTAADVAVTSIQMGAGEAQVARASTVVDADGTRRATMIFPAGTAATMTLPDGTQRVATTLSVRATEYTVGSAGPAAMPAPLPPLSAYTYAMELSADEAEGGEVQFDRPVSYYLENFLGFPAGTPVPVGYYDRKAGAWIPEPNGRVLKVVAINAGVAQLDVTGDGVADGAATLATLGIDSTEQQKLATLYSAGASLWRLTMMHFSPFDGNFPAVPPEGATAPSNTKPSVPKLSDKTCKIPGSVIECSNQVLGEDLALIGTGLGLHYRSDRMRGHRPGSSATIQLTGASIPANVDGVELEIEIAGQFFAESFPASPNQTIVFTWDGKDSYGREVLGARPATIRVGYRYVAEYVRPGDAPRSFGQPGGQRFTELVRRNELMTALWQEHRVDLGGIDYRGIGIGGWSLSPHHFYDFSRGILYRGDGSRRSADAIGSVLTTAAGSIGKTSYSGDGGLATSAGLDFPRSVAVGPDGSIYLNEISRIRRVDPSGVITTIAGTGTRGYSGDGGAATAARISSFGEIAIGTDGTLYIADTGNARIRRVRNGIISTVAGTGASWGGGGTPYPDGTSATATAIEFVDGIAVAQDGTIYFTSNGYIERITSDGNLYRVAGGAPRSTADGISALTAAIGESRLAVNDDGVLFLTDSSRIRNIGADGIIRTVAGRQNCTSSDPTGDGGPAREACVDAWSFALDGEGRIYIAERFKNIVRVVDSDGVITRLAGTGTAPFPAVAGGGLARATPVAAPWDVATAPDGSVLVIDFNGDLLRRIASPFSGFSMTEFTIPEEDGRTLHYFDSSGRHLRTVDSVTGVVVLRFGYNSDGQLVSITDADNRIVSVEWNAGVPAAIVAPTGERTVLDLGSDGYLSTITNSASETERLEYRAGGLLRSYTDARESAHEFRYDEQGRLLFDGDPDGGSTTLSRTGTDLSFTVTRTSSESDTTIYAVTNEAERSTAQVTDASGLTTVTQRTALGQTTITAPQGSTSLIEMPDSRFGAAASLTSSTLSTPGGLTQSVTNSRIAQLSDPTNPLSVTRLIETRTINGRAWRIEYDVATRTQSIRSPAGRTATATLDASGRPLQVVTPGLDAATYTWDDLGRLSAFSIGRRMATFDYDEKDRITSLTDSLDRTTSFTYDEAGRVTNQTLPDSRQIAFSYDSNGNLTTLTPPGRAPHSFSFTAGNLMEASEVSDAVTRYTYSQDRALTSIERPDGLTVALGYDAARRVATMRAGANEYSFAYNELGTVQSVTSTDGGTVSYSYDGPLLTSTTWTGGGITGSIAYAYDNNLRMVSESGISFGYDADGLLTTAGALQLQRNATNALLSGTSLGAVSDSYTYNQSGEITSYVAAYNGSPLRSHTYARDASGRITTIDAKGFEYDAVGRLIRVTNNGALVAEYDYDANSNRIAHRYLGGSATATYDDQDRLLTYGDITYEHTANGDLKSKTLGGATTTFDYDAFGNLRNVQIPGRRIDYVIDGQNRRIGKKVDNILVRGWLYADQLRIVAELDATGSIISRFVYGSRANVPNYMTKGGVTYRIIGDHLGSPRLVINVADGTIAQRIEYDEFGRVLTDSNPGFQPFGFAGGLYDQDTGLVRFGARDYDPHTGRWTTKDPLGFGGGDPNLYSYVGSDPMNFIDPSGLDQLTADPHVQEIVTSLWKTANYGGDAYEVFAFIMRDPVTKSYSCKLLPKSYEQNKFTLKKGVKIPPNTVAVMHTHPRSRTTEPHDPGDVVFANAFNRMIVDFEALYTISRRGVGKFTPGANRGTQEETTLNFPNKGTDGCGCQR